MNEMIVSLTVLAVLFPVAVARCFFVANDCTLYCNDILQNHIYFHFPEFIEFCACIL